MKTIEFHVRGTVPLLMHNGRLSNPLDPMSKAMSAITSKKKKTDDDRLELMHREWEGGLYFDNQLGPYLPSEVIEGTIRNGAKISKQGNDILRGVACSLDRYKLDYKGPRTLEGLWAEGANSPGGQVFVDVRGARLKSGRVQRTRAIFRTWEVKFDLQYNPEIIDEDSLLSIVEVAGAQIGFCDYRPKYGRFEVL